MTARLCPACGWKLCHHTVLLVGCPMMQGLIESENDVRDGTATWTTFAGLEAALDAKADRGD